MYEWEEKIVKCEEIELNPVWTPRSSVSNDHVETLREAIRAGKELPPVLLDNRLQVIDGLHRIYAHVKSGIPTIKAKVLKNDIPDYEKWSLAVKSNSEHGLPLTLSEKRRVFTRFFESETFCKKDEWNSDRYYEVAAMFDLAVETVKKWVESAQGKASAIRGSGTKAKSTEPHVSPTVIDETLPEVAETKPTKIETDPSSIVVSHLRQALLYACNEEVTAEKIYSYFPDSGSEYMAFAASIEEAWQKIVAAVQLFLREVMGLEEGDETV